MKNGILVTLVFLMLVSGIILPVIINKASAVPSTTLAGVSSVGKCNEGTSSAIFSRITQLSCRINLTFL